MPRPNHDIPNLLLGGVRDYAAENDISREEAHIQLLELALKDVGILSCESSQSSETAAETRESGDADDENGENDKNGTGDGADGLDEEDTTDTES